MNLEYYVSKIIEETGLTRSEVAVLIEQKKNELNNLISSEAALFIIFKELVMLQNEKKQFSQRKIAIGLNKQAKNQIKLQLSLFYKEDGFPQLIKLLNFLDECVFISMQKIEGRTVSTKLLFIEKDVDQEWPEKTRFIRFVRNISIPFEFDSFKKFIEISVEPNVCLVISIPNQRTDEDLVNILGLLVFNESIDFFASQFNLWELTPQKYKKPLKSIYNSILVSIEHEKVRVSYFNNDISIIEKGQLIKVKNPDLEKFINKFLERSNFFHLIEEYEEEGAPYLFDTYFSALCDIIIKISEKRHGSILIFGYDEEMNNEALFHPGAIELEVPFLTFIQKYDIKNKSEIFEIISMFKELIINLSNTDGALIFNKNLDLKAAGVFLKVEESSIGAGGARKKSAEEFVKKIRKMGISISQDGPITFYDYYNET